MHQIYLNDILNDRNAFYKEQLFSIRDEKVLFDENVWNLLHHLNVRSDFFISKDIRDILMDIYPASGKILTEDKGNVTYVQIDGFANKSDQDFTKGIYEIHTKKPLTIGEYFEKWESLILKLQKIN